MGRVSTPSVIRAGALLVHPTIKSAVESLAFSAERLSSYLFWEGTRPRRPFRTFRSQSPRLRLHRDSLRCSPNSGARSPAFVTQWSGLFTPAVVKLWFCVWMMFQKKSPFTDPAATKPELRRGWRVSGVTLTCFITQIPCVVGGFKELRKGASGCGGYLNDISTIAATRK